MRFRSRTATPTIADPAPPGSDAAALVVDPDVFARFAEVGAAVGLRLRRVDPAADPLGSDAALLRSAPVVLVDIARVSDLPEAAGDRAVIALAPAAPTAEQWQDCLERGVRTVHQLSDPDEDLVRSLTSILERVPTETRRPIIAVTGACGGAGASVFSAALAVRARAAGQSVLLCDVDHCGFGLETLLAAEGVGGTSWADIGARRISAESLSEALPRAPGRGAPLRVMGFGRGPRDRLDPELVRAVVSAGGRAGDLVILDLPRCAEVSRALVPWVDLAVTVVTADLRGGMGALRAAELLAFARSAGLVVRGPSAGGLAAAEIARAVEVPLLAAMPPQPGLDRDLERGRAWRRLDRSPLGRAADRVLAQADGAV